MFTFGLFFSKYEVLLLHMRHQFDYVKPFEALWALFAIVRSSFLRWSRPTKSNGVLRAATEFIGTAGSSTKSSTKPCLITIINLMNYTMLNQKID